MSCISRASPFSCVSQKQGSLVVCPNSKARELYILKASPAWTILCTHILHVTPFWPCRSVAVMRPASVKEDACSFPSLCWRASLLCYRHLFPPLPPSLRHQTPPPSRRCHVRTVAMGIAPSSSPWTTPGARGTPLVLRKRGLDSSPFSASLTGQNFALARWQAELAITNHVTANSELFVYSQ